MLCMRVLAIMMSLECVFCVEKDSVSLNGSLLEEMTWIGCRPIVAWSRGLHLYHFNLQISYYIVMKFRCPIHKVPQCIF